jgi:hypothetical protein
VNVDFQCTTRHAQIEFGQNFWMQHSNIDVALEETEEIELLTLIRIQLLDHCVDNINIGNSGLDVVWFNHKLKPIK